MEILTRPLEDALADLVTNMGLFGEARPDTPPAQKKAFRSASIQSFEFTYALAIKLIDRLLLARGAAAEEIESLEFLPRMRLAWEKGIVRDPLAWAAYRAHRNATSHAYMEAKAIEVYGALAAFVDDVRFVLRRAREGAHAD
jgi:nucleotidyltransferase substrate binding protein (TIGR01987 family)